MQSMASCEQPHDCAISERARRVPHNDGTSDDAAQMPLTAPSLTAASLAAACDVQSGEAIVGVAVDENAPTVVQKKKNSRSAEAKAARHKKTKAKRRAAAAAAQRVVVHTEMEAAPTARERELEAALKQTEKLLRLARRSKRRDETTAWQRGRQHERRDSKQAKAQKQKRGARLERALAGAARRERARATKGKAQLTGGSTSEPLHTGERKRKQSEAQLRERALRARLNSYKSGICAPSSSGTN
jgi:hypothetical protein